MLPRAGVEEKQTTQVIKEISLPPLTFSLISDIGIVTKLLESHKKH